MNAAVLRLRDRLFERMRDPNPILVKELRATFRTKLFIRFLYLSTLFVSLVVLAAGAMSATASLPPADVGKLVFQIFFAMALVIVGLVAPAYAAAALTSEKELRTYESLLLSGMAPGRIVWGKFLACYGSMFLVLIAFAPVVGIAFLFGGIALSHVLFAYAALLLVLAPSVAFGVALSARLQSMRVAILIAIIVAAPVPFTLLGIMTGIGEAAAHDWGVGMEGPFWFTEALTNRFFEPDTFGLLVLLPLFLFGMPTWFFLAAAIAGVRPDSDDRSSPFKVWAVVSAVGLVAMVSIGVALFTDARDAADASVGFAMLAGTALLFYALLFMNEPALPPRAIMRRREGYGFLRRLLTPFGPGAAPTARFAVVLIAATSIAVACLPVVVRHVVHRSYYNDLRYDAALVVLALGNGAVMIAVLTFGAWLRVLTRNGIASRVLSLALLAAATIVPFLAAVIIDPSALERMDDEMPLFMNLSPIMPMVLAGMLAGGEYSVSHGALVLVPTIVYGLSAAFFFVMLEVKVRQDVNADRARRAARRQRERTSSPSLPALQTERTSLIPDGPGSGDGGAPLHGRGPSPASSALSGSNSSPASGGLPVSSGLPVSNPFSASNPPPDGIPAARTTLPDGTAPVQTRVFADAGASSRQTPKGPATGDDGGGVAP